MKGFLGLFGLIKFVVFFLIGFGLGFVFSQWAPILCVITGGMWHCFWFQVVIIAVVIAFLLGRVF